ncbi:hypothetical protein CASFOL_025021 [Castilleja foliolosa]|uniref:Uncharacterized protein n=1 Tax=Castilleja foliolosa TaxID=1961234 RepID=A0ABD3CR13_9LAMI
MTPTWRFSLLVSLHVVSNSAPHHHHHQTISARSSPSSSKFQPVHAGLGWKLPELPATDSHQPLLLTKPPFTSTRRNHHHQPSTPESSSSSRPESWKLELRSSSTPNWSSDRIPKTLEFLVLIERIAKLGLRSRFLCANRFRAAMAEEEIEYDADLLLHLGGQAFDGVLPSGAQTTIVDVVAGVNAWPESTRGWRRWS